MNTIKSIEETAENAYKLLQSNRSKEACDVFLHVWEDLKALMAQDSLRSIQELQAAYPWSDFISNWVQDTEQELHNAGIDNPEYFEKRIRFCEELLIRTSEEDQLLIENTRRAIADSHAALGHAEECDRLFQAWLEEDPTWGWGYIGWSDSYHFIFGKMKTDLDKAARIISQALEVADLRDRADVADRAIEIFKARGENEKAARLSNELSKWSENQRKGRSKTLLNHESGGVKADKVGRNEPCPCGSGKKYKKCCAN